MESRTSAPSESGSSTFASGASPNLSDYVGLAGRIVQGGLISDPWVLGVPRFRRAPLVISRNELDELYDATERLVAVYHEAMMMAADEPSLLRDSYRLTEWQTRMAVASLPSWHGIARADVFRVKGGGVRICELNCDTPTGEPEAISLGSIATEPGLEDPNREFEERFSDMVAAVVRANVSDEGPRNAAIIYPTDLPEDLAVVRLYGSWLVRRGWRVVVGSPFNVTTNGDGVPCIFGTPCSLILRHYKTDWWGERMPVWRNVPPYPSTEPLTAPLLSLLWASVNRRCAVVNPFGSVVAQNKRTMALFWERIESFSPAARATIRELVPFTSRLECIDADGLRGARDEWVLKSDYGCEGDEVIVGRYVDDATWRETIEKAIPERWIAQRRIEIEEDAEGSSVNYGVFALGGRASGLYTRVQRGPTNERATSTPVLVRKTERER